jgi:hypothetical protein
LTHKLRFGIDAKKKILVTFIEKLWSSEEMSSMGPSDWLETNLKKSKSNPSISRQHPLQNCKQQRTCPRQSRMQQRTCSLRDRAQQRALGKTMLRKMTSQKIVKTDGTVKSFRCKARQS